MGLRQKKIQNARDQATASFSSFQICVAAIGVSGSAAIGLGGLTTALPVLVIVVLCLGTILKCPVFSTQSVTKKGLMGESHTETITPVDPSTTSNHGSGFVNSISQILGNGGAS